MWAQLALAGVKSLQDAQNRRNDIASNVITQKYSPWTGARADFSSQGKNNTLSNMISGYGAGMLQDKLDAKETAEAVASAQDKKLDEWKSDADFYGKLSSNPSSVGVSPVASKSAFSVATRAPAGREPAIMDGGNQAPSSSSLPSFLQASNPWQALAQQPLPERQPLMSDFHQPAQSYSPPGSQWFWSTPFGRSMK